MALSASQIAEPPTSNVERLEDASTRNHEHSRAFVSGHVLAGLVVFLLALTAVLTLSHLGVHYAQIRELASMPAGRAMAQAAAFGPWQTAFTIAETVMLLVTAVFFLRWVYRVRTNIPALGVRGLQFSPRWAVAGFLVPIVNLIVPVRIVEEIWRASNPHLLAGDAWRTERASRLIEWWWGAFLLAQLLDKFTARAVMAGGRTASDLLFVSWIMLVSQILAIVAALLAMLIVRGIQSRQEEKAKRLAEVGMSREEFVLA